MFKRQKRRARGRGPLSYANVVASLALFIALGGTAAAAVTLGRDSVGAREIRGDAVRSPEISSGAVRSSELRDEGVKIADISPGAQTALLGDLHREDAVHRPRSARTTSESASRSRSNSRIRRRMREPGRPSSETTGDRPRQASWAGLRSRSHKAKGSSVHRDVPEAATQTYGASESGSAP